MSSRRLMFMSAVTLAVASMVPAGASAANGLLGAGASLAAPLEAEWAAAFQVFTGISVSYDQVGSETGLRDIASRAVDFATTEAPLTRAEGSACHSCYQIPWRLSVLLCLGPG